MGSPIRSGWKNIHHVRAGLEYKPQPKLSLAGGYHSFWLASARDALYNAGGTPIARIATGAPDRHVGQELDMQATFTPSPRIQLHGGYSHLFTGAFLKDRDTRRVIQRPLHHGDDDASWNGEIAMTTGPKLLAASF